LKTQTDTNTDEIFLEGLGKRGWIALAKLSGKEPNVFQAYKALCYALQCRRNRRGRGGVRTEFVSTTDILKAVKDLRKPEFQAGMAQIAPFQEYEHEGVPAEDIEDADIPSEGEGLGNEEPIANRRQPGNQDAGELDENLDVDEDFDLRRRVRDILGPDKFEQLQDSVYLMAESLRDAVEEEAVENYIEQHLQQVFDIIINHQLE
jgi:hypothetical protein